MRKALLVTAGFLLFACFGPVVLLLLTIAAFEVWMRLRPALPNPSGIGAVAGGISEVAVMVVPVLFGVCGALTTLLFLNRRKPPSSPKRENMEY